MSYGGTDFNCKEGLCELPSANQKILITSKGDNRADKIKNGIFLYHLMKDIKHLKVSVDLSAKFS